MVILDNVDNIKAHLTVRGAIIWWW